MTGKQQGIGCFVLFILLMTGIPLLMAVGAPETTHFPRPFNSVDWKSEAWVPGKDVADESKRCRMILDLTWRVGVVGKTEAEILSLLGKADYEVGGMPFRYLLCPSWLDIYVLELEWRDGKVSSARVRDT